MKWLKRTLYLLILLLAVVGLLPFVLPFDAYLPRVEKLAGEALHQPVTIRTMRAGLLPLPYVLLQGVAVGPSREVRADSVKIVPDPFSLLHRTKVIRSVSLDGVSLPEKALGGLAAGFSGDGGPPAVVVRRIELGRVEVAAGRTAIGPFGGTIRMNARGGFSQARLATDDARLTLKVVPAGENFLIEADGKDWRPPAGPPLHFDALKVRAVASGGGMDFERIEGRLYQGDVSGSATLGWKDGWRLKGRLRCKGIELKDAAPLFATHTRLSGKLSAEAAFVMHGASAQGMLARPTVEARFSVADGVLYNLDLVAAVKMLTARGVRGGQTRFDQLSGVVRLADGAYRLSDLTIVSGLLAASGNAEISRSKRLSGRMDVQLKGTAGLVGAPLALSGTLHEPVLRPTEGAVAGALAGTAVLGPGVGTSLGMKAGALVEKIFK